MHTILLVDDELPLLTLLQDLLSLPGERAVEFQEGLFGLTAELMLISKPSLIIINPRMVGLSEEDLTSLVLELRARSQARILFIADLPDQELADTVARFRADAGIPIRRLLADPLAQLSLGRAGTAPAPVPHLSGQVPRSLEEMDAEEIMDTDVLEELPAPPPAAVFPAAVLPARLERTPVFPSMAPSEESNEVVQLILAELSSVPLASAASEQRFSVALDNFSDHNVYSDAQGPAGVFVASVMCPRQGDVVTVDVSFPWNHRVTWQGSVAWTRSAGMGALGRRRKAGFAVRLTQPTAEDKVLLARFAQLRAPLQHAA